MIRTQASRPLDRDKLSMVPRDTAIMEAYRALDAIQNNDPEVQVAAVSILFAAYMKRTGINAHGAWLMGTRIMEDAKFDRKANDQVRSMLDFMGLRVMGDANVGIA